MRRRLEHLESLLSDMRDLRMDVLPGSSVSVTGTEQKNYTLRLWADAEDQEDDQALVLIERTELVQDSHALVLKHPDASGTGACVFYLDVVGPAERPVTITGHYVAIDVYGIFAPIDISTCHARVSVLDTSGDVDVEAPEGQIVWASQRGRVRLSAGAIDVKIPGQTYDWPFEATATRSIRILFPHGFTSPFDVTVGRDDQFVCRADIRSHFRRREQPGRLLHEYGSGDRVLHFVCMDGAVTIDNTPPSHS